LQITKKKEKEEKKISSNVSFFCNNKGAKGGQTDSQLSSGNLQKVISLLLRKIILRKTCVELR